jgi:hypothetical protein
MQLKRVVTWRSALFRAVPRCSAAFRLTDLIGDKGTVMAEIHVGLKLKSLTPLLLL